MPAWVYLTFTNNLYLATHGTLFFLPATWSLAIEEQFYLTLPLLVRYLPQRWLPRIVFSSIAVVLCLRVATCAMGTLTQGQMYMLPWFRADTLMVGVGCAMIARSPSLAALVQRRRGALYVLLALGGVTLWRVGWWLAPEHDRPRIALMGWGLTLLALLYGGVLLMAVLACPAWFSRFLRWKALRFLGGISYFVYLAHQPLLAAALNVALEVRGRWQSIAQWCAVGVAYALTLLIGDLSWKYYESRMVTLGHYWKFSRRRTQEAEPAVKIAA
jgi:peptidoglycan/LPS O-acetylase OafA/YrhL